MELVVGTIYRCADGDIRKLDQVEEGFLHYSIPIGKQGTAINWMPLSKTYRHQVESLFVNGEEITEAQMIEEE